MMVKKLVFYIFVLLICLWLASSARAVIQYGQDAWDVRLDSDQSITCVAHFVWGGVKFSDVPIQLDWSDYIGGDWGDIGWQAMLSADSNIAYIYGPQITNTTGDDNVKWFAYNLSYLWDDEDPDFDPDWPVYIDTAIYNGPYGSAPIDYWGWRGTPGIQESWEYRDEPYVKDQPWYTEDFFDNPAPEPMTICLLGLGALFLRKTRFLKIS
jgi:hypothetical protein